MTQASNARLEFSLPTVARIVKGGPKRKNQKGQEIVGLDLKDKFRIAFYPGTEEYQDLYRAAHPDAERLPNGDFTAKRIDAMLMFPSVWDSIQIWNEAYQAGRMVVRANDRQIITKRDPLTGAYVIRNGDPYEEWIPGEDITYQREGKTFTLPIRTAIRFQLFLPELARWVAFQLKSTSYYDSINLRHQLGAIQTMANWLNNGAAGGIPIILFRREQEVTWNQDSGKAARVKQWLINVEINPEWVASAISRMKNFALTGEQLHGMLLPPSTITGKENPELGAGDPDEPEMDFGDQAPQEDGLIIDVTPDDMLDSTPAEDPQHDPEPVDDLAPDLRYAPELLRDKVKAAAKAVMDKYDGSPPEDEALRDRMKAALEGILGEEAKANKHNPAQARGALQFYLTGFRSMSKGSGMGIEYVIALKRWLVSPVLEEDGSQTIDPMSEREAIAAYRHSQGKNWQED